jgi:phosphoenolpyruvate carboxykinase (GTP)
VVARCAGKAGAVETPIGLLPAAGEIDTTGLDVTPATMQALLDVPRDEWRAEAENMGEFFAKFGKRLPDEIERQRRQLMERL